MLVYSFLPKLFLLYTYTIYLLAFFIVFFWSIISIITNFNNIILWYLKIERISAFVDVILIRGRIRWDSRENFNLKIEGISAIRKVAQEWWTDFKMSFKFLEYLKVSKHDSIRIKRFYINILNTLRLSKIIIKINIY